jgi:hypothetical protein
MLLSGYTIPWVVGHHRGSGGAGGGRAPYRLAAKTSECIIEAQARKGGGY